MPKVWIISTIMGESDPLEVLQLEGSHAGILLAAGTWILRATLFLNDGGVIQNWGSVQGILFLEVALTESWVICEFSPMTACRSAHG